MIPKLVERYCLIASLTRENDSYFKASPVGKKAKLNREELITIAVIKQFLGVRINKSLYRSLRFYRYDISLK